MNKEECAKDLMHRINNLINCGDKGTAEKLIVAIFPNIHEEDLAYLLEGKSKIVGKDDTGFWIEHLSKKD